MLVTVPTRQNPQKADEIPTPPPFPALHSNRRLKCSGPRVCARLLFHIAADERCRLSVDFQEIQHHRQKSFRVIDMHGMACIGNHDGLREGAAFPHFIIEEGVALGTPFSREK